MGYTHYWYRKEELPVNLFIKVVKDFKIIEDSLSINNLYLAGPLGDGTPIINDELISFNGNRYCGHTLRDLGITWPSDNAGGTSENGETDGNWFGGNLLSTRTCGGDCSNETFHLPRIFEPGQYRQPEGDDYYFDFCKTAYKPYDLAVTAALVIAKHHLKDLIVVSTDGNDKDWFDARQMCQMLLGYGLDIKMFDRTPIAGG